MNIIRNPHGPFGILRKSSRSSLHAVQMLDRAPLAVMMCDLDLTITYANEASIAALRKIQHALPVPADTIVGQSIDIFHKNPTHQRRMLRDPKNLPHKARIKLGDEWLDLHIVAITDAKGSYIGPMLSWSIVTDEVRHARETQKLLTMLDMMPINVMLADKDTFEITYANRTSMETLRPLESQLPCKADQIIGKNIDIFHKKPIHQRTMLANHAATLPHRAVINLGAEKLELNISPLNTAQGEYMGPLLTWSVVTDSIAVASQIKEVMSSVSNATTEMQASADALSNNAGQTNAQVATVASASEELSVSISEISRQITRSTNVAQAARSDMDHAARVMVDLTAAADKIDKVVNLINDIAEKTNLLALNATIEAARAGDAGKGFAVVASEVKALASQTGQATGEISAQVSGIQHAIKATAAANQAIGRTIVEINEISSSISAAIEQQLAATQNVAVNITEVSKASTETGRISGNVNTAAKELAARADGLQTAMMSFIARYTAAR